MSQTKQKTENATSELLSLEDYILQDRERAVREVQRQVVDVNQLFADVAQMVHLQGDHLDNIEACLENAKTSTGRGVRQLQQAETRKAWFDGVKTTVATIGTAILATAAIIVLL